MHWVVNKFSWLNRKKDAKPLKPLIFTGNQKEGYWCIYPGTRRPAQSIEFRELTRPDPEIGKADINFDIYGWYVFVMQMVPQPEIDVAPGWAPSSSAWSLGKHRLTRYGTDKSRLKELADFDIEYLAGVIVEAYDRNNMDPPRIIYLSLSYGGKSVAPS